MVQASQDRDSFKANRRAQVQQARAMERFERNNLDAYVGSRKQKTFRVEPSIRVTKPQVAILLPCIIALNCLPVAAAQPQRSAFVDCNKNDVCFDPDTPAIPAQSTVQENHFVQGCFPFADVQKLSKQSYTNVMLEKALNEPDPNVSQLVKLSVVCNSLTPKEQNTLREDFNNRIAPRVGHFIELAQHLGRKPAIMFSASHNRCSALVQEIQLLKLLRYYGISNLMLETTSADLSHGLQQAKILSDPGISSLGLDNSFLVTFSRLNYYLAFNFQITPVDESRHKVEIVANFLNRIFELSNVKAQAFKFMASNNAETKIAGAHLLKYTAKEFNKLPIIHNLMEREQDIARIITQKNVSFLLPAGIASIGPLYQKIRNSLTHLFFIIRASPDSAVALQREGIEKIAMLLDKKNFSNYQLYVETINGITHNRFPCAIHPVLDEKLLSK